MRCGRTPDHPFDLVVLAGDGVGPEVMRELTRILQVLSDSGAVALRIEEAPIGGASITATGSPLAPGLLDRCRRADAVLVGAVGGPQWDDLPPECRPETGLLLLRRGLEVYANIRPVRLHPALAGRSPLRPRVIAGGVDLVVVRELTGGLYYGPRGREGEGDQARAHDTLCYARPEIERLAAAGFQLAARRRGKLASVDKANVLASSRLWRQTVDAMAARFPGVAVEHLYVDNCAMQMVLNPSRFDVIITENTFGDILSDLGAALVGSIGLLPSASLSGPGRPGLYEPVHGSAPDIAGTGQANPVGAILAGAMMLRHGLGREDLALEVEAAVDEALAGGMATPDIAGPESTVVSTRDSGQWIARVLVRRLQGRPAREERRGPDEAPEQDRP